MARPHSANSSSISELTAKTIKRAIDALSTQYQIIEEPDGREVRYRFSDDYKFVPPTRTPSELATLLLAQESIAATGLTAFGSPYYSVLDRSYPRALRDGRALHPPAGLRPARVSHRELLQFAFTERPPSPCAPTT